MPRVEVELLGTFTVRTDGRATTRWEHRRAADLVALLALAPGHRLVRDQALDALWPDLPPEAAAANLHKAAHHARHSLGGADAVVLRSGVVALFPGAEIRTDVERFEAAARRALAVGDRAVCAAAADLHAEGLLPDRLYDDWTVPHRDRLRRLHVDLLRGAGRWDEVVAAEPTDEAAHRALMREYLAAGNRHASVRQFQRLRGVLARELGLRPSPDTVALHRDAVAGLARAASSPTAPLVGREVALGRLHAALRSADRRGGGCLVVTGEAGIGKTRLCAEFTAQAQRAAFTVLSASGGPAAVPFGVARQLIHSAHPERLAGLPDELRAALHDGPAQRQQLLAALQDGCGARDTLLIVDDAHLADDDSVALLDMLLRAPAARCTVLLAMRPEAAREPLTGLRAAPTTIEVDLPPLARDESDELVTSICGNRPAAPLLARVWHLATGNPFVITELAAALARSGSVEIPPGLAEAVSARLSGCRSELVGLLRRVAVVAAAADADGLDGVDVDEFTALTGLDEEAAFAALDEAMAAGVLVADGDGYLFRHALVARCLANGVPPHRRREIHRAAAGRLAARGAAPSRVARHLDAGGRPAEAVRWHVEAARVGGAASAYAEALRHVEAALAAAPGRADLLALRADFRHARGDPLAPIAYAEAAAAASGARRDELRLRQAWALLLAGDVPGCVQAAAGVVPGETTRVRLSLIRGLTAWFTGSIADAERAAAETMRLALARGDTAEVLDSALLHALVAHSQGRWAAQLQLDLFDPRLAGALAGMLSDAHLCVGELYLVGDTPAAEIIDFAIRLRATADEAGAARGAAFATTLLGEAELSAGDLDAAEKHLLDGARAHRTLGARGGEAVAMHALAELALAAGRPAAVVPLLDEALHAARLSPLSARHLLTRIYGTRIQVAPDDAAALAVLDEAQANLVRPTEVCPLCWVPYLVPAATVLARTGRPDAAEPMLEAAEQLVGVLWSGRGQWADAVAAGRAALATARGGS